MVSGEGWSEITNSGVLGRVDCDADHRPRTDREQQQRKVAKTERDRWERQMSYLSNVVNERPMLRAAASVIVAFCLAAPLVWLFSNLVVYGLRSVL
jgi:hypothetical protein